MECHYYEHRTKGLTQGFKKVLGIALSNEYYCPIHREIHKIKEDVEYEKQV